MRQLLRFLLVFALFARGDAQAAAAVTSSDQARALAARWRLRRRPDLAETFLGRARTQAQLAGDALADGRALTAMADLAGAQGRCRPALGHLLCAQRAYQQVLRSSARPEAPGFPDDAWLPWEASRPADVWREYQAVMAAVARLAALAGEWRRALSARLALVATRSARVGPTEIATGWALAELGEAHAILGDVAAAATAYRQALRILEPEVAPARLQPLRKALLRLRAAGTDDARIPWRASIRREELTLPHDAPVEAVRFLDGDRLLTLAAEHRGGGHVWDLETGVRVRDLVQFPRVLSMTSVPGRSEWIGARPGRVWRFDFGGRGVLPPLASRRLGRVFPAVAVSPDGVLIAAGGGPVAGEPAGPAEILLWRRESTRLVDVRRWEQPGAVLALAFSPSRRYLAAGGEDGVVRVRDLLRGDRSVALQGHSGAITGLAFLAGDRRLLSTSSDGSLREWDTFTGNQVRALTGHRGPVLCLAVRPAGQTAVTGGEDGTVRVWNMAVGGLRHELRGEGGPVLSVDITQDIDLVASGHRDGRATLWRLLGAAD